MKKMIERAITVSVWAAVGLAGIVMISLLALGITGILIVSVINILLTAMADGIEDILDSVLSSHHRLSKWIKK